MCHVTEHVLSLRISVSAVLQKAITRLHNNWAPHIFYTYKVVTSAFLKEGPRSLGAESDIMRQG